MDTIPAWTNTSRLSLWGNDSWHLLLPMQWHLDMIEPIWPDISPGVNLQTRPLSLSQYQTVTNLSEQPASSRGSQYPQVINGIIQKKWYPDFLGFQPDMTILAVSIGPCNWNKVLGKTPNFWWLQHICICWSSFSFILYRVFLLTGTPLKSESMENLG